MLKAQFAKVKIKEDNSSKFSTFSKFSKFLN